MIIQSQEITTPQYKFFRVAVFLLFINAMYPWPVWEVKLPIAAIIAFIASWYIFLDKKHYIKGERESKIILIAYLLLALWFYRNFTIWGILGHAIAAFPTIMIFFLKKEYKYDLLLELCKDDYFRLIGFYKKIYDKINISLVFSGVLLTIIASRLDFSNLSQVNSNGLLI